MRFVRKIKTGDGRKIDVVVPETEDERAEVTRKLAAGEVDWRESSGDRDRPNPYRAKPRTRTSAKGTKTG